jgi:hypothetical protein
MREIIQDE